MAGEILTTMLDNRIEYLEQLYYRLEKPIDLVEWWDPEDLHRERVYREEAGDEIWEWILEARKARGR